MTLSDFSPGMLQQARENLQKIAHSFTYREVDAQAIPFADESLDAVIANHMLYHVPNLDQALAEIQRVLKPGGRLFTSTVGYNHHHQMQELRRKFKQQTDVPDHFDDFEEHSADAFVLQNGERLLAPWFTTVTLHDYEDALAVTEAKPLYDYMLSGFRTKIDRQLHSAFLTFLEQALAAANGILHIDKESGLFVATK